MRAELGLPSVKGDDELGGGMTGGFGGSMGGAAGAKSKRPINVKFEIPYFTTSGIQVRYLKIIEPKVSQWCGHVFLVPRTPFKYRRQWRPYPDACAPIVFVLLYYWCAVGSCTMYQAVLLLGRGSKGSLVFSP